MSGSAAAAPSSRNPIRRLYDWVLGMAETRYGLPALFVLAVAESSFFPIPPDVLLIALSLAVPTRAFRYAAWCTAGSVIGGVIGYYLGSSLWNVLEPYMINRLISEANFDAVASQYREYGFTAVFIAAFTPIPYKVFTVAAGVAGLDLAGFVFASIVGRGARFVLVALVIRTVGSKAKEFIDRYFNLVTIVGTVVLVGGFALIRRM